MVTAANKKLTFKVVKDAVFRTAETTAMVMILLAASTFMGVGLLLPGDARFHRRDASLLQPAAWIFIIGILAVAFVLGWPLEWVPIVVVIIPIFLPILHGTGVNMIWFAILLAVTLRPAGSRRRWPCRPII